MQDVFFEKLRESEKNCIAFLKRQESAATITLTGPTSSTKSTLMTEVAPPPSNKLLGKNVGVDAQTSLVRTLLMLNGRLSEYEVLIQCIPHQDKDLMLLKFLTILREEMITSMYKMRDDLDEFEVDRELIKRILNPVNRSYHAYDFAYNQGLTEDFITILDDICKNIIMSPEPLETEVNRVFKERKKTINESNKTDKSAKNIQKVQKKDIYEEIIDARFSENNQNIDSLSKWFNSLIERVYFEFKNFWTFSGNGSFIFADNISDNIKVSNFIEKIYGDNSACALIFEEIRYVTSPSDGFKQAFNRVNENHPGRNAKINLLDTVGLTQSSQQEEDINEAVDLVLQRETDAVLFLCASDEQPSIYQTCITLLKDKNEKLSEKPVLICRTKADIVIRNIISNLWRQETGRNGVPSFEEGYKEYCERAFSEFNQNYIEANAYGEEEIGKKMEFNKVDFLSLAPDFSENMNKVLDNKLSSSKTFEILINLIKEIDKSYSSDGNRPWLYSKDLENTPLVLISKTKQLTKTISTALTAYNSKQNNQYLPYSISKDIFHGRSVNCFWSKLSYGEGHETRALYYGNFKIYLRNMVSRWLREMIPFNELLNGFGISDEYLSSGADSKIVLKEFEYNFRELVKQRWWGIVNNVSKKLTYDCLQPELNNCFHYNSWDRGFRESLALINNKFSSVDYWNDNLEKLFMDEIDSILQRMYIFDEV